jgi:hypothetical protein
MMTRVFIQESDFLTFASLLLLDLVILGADYLNVKKTVSTATG